MGDDPEYYKTIQHQMDAWTPDTRIRTWDFSFVRAECSEGVKDKYEAIGRKNAGGTKTENAPSVGDWPEPSR